MRTPYPKFSPAQPAPAAARHAPGEAHGGLCERSGPLPRPSLRRSCLRSTASRSVRPASSVLAPTRHSQVQIQEFHGLGDGAGLVCCGVVRRKSWHATVFVIPGMECRRTVRGGCTFCGDESASLRVLAFVRRPCFFDVLFGDEHDDVARGSRRSRRGGRRDSCPFHGSGMICRDLIMWRDDRFFPAGFVFP